MVVVKGADNVAEAVNAVKPSVLVEPSMLVEAVLLTQAVPKFICIKELRKCDHGVS